MKEAGVEHGSSSVQWGPFRHVAFRFCFVYFGLYIVATQFFDDVLQVPGVHIPDLGSLWPMRPIVSWTAVHVFHHRAELIIAGSGSIDKIYDWVEAFCLLLIALTATIVWTLLDRKRPNYLFIYKWFRLLVRFAVGATLLSYGFYKVIPLQMPFPSLHLMVKPFGRFSPMDVLWASIGASPGYEIFTGCAEILGGILIMIPQTTTLGALVCLADATQVFVLNMTYDVPLKLFSFHMVLLCVFLLSSDAQRLYDFFIRRAPVRAPDALPLFQTSRANRSATRAQIVFLGYLTLTNAIDAGKAWKEYGGGAPVSALHGIWDVDEFSSEGQIRPPLLTDTFRWRRFIVDSPQFVICQRMDDSFLWYAVEMDERERRFALKKRDSGEPVASFTFQQPVPSGLLLDGVIEGRNVLVRLKLVDPKTLLLLDRGFHWIQEYPFGS